MNSSGTKSTGKIWTIAAIVGVVAFVILKWWVAYTFWPALLLAILIAILVAILLWIGFYRGDDDDLGTISGVGGAAALGATGAAAATSKPADTGGSSTQTPSAANLMGSPATASSKPAIAPAKSAAKPAKAKATASQKKPAKRKPATKKPAAKKPAAKKPAAKAAPTGASTAASIMGDAGQAMAAEKKAAKAKPARKPVAKDGKPATMKKARAGGADDLKQIKGVGPGLEKTLNELGFYHFDQVAGWRAKEIEWVDSRLKFKGRIVRDEWTKQCKTLAKGGQTAFSKRVKKGDVY